MTMKIQTTLLHLVIGLSVAACGGNHDASERGPRAPVDVQVEASAVESIEQRFEAGGVVRARTTATLVSRIVADVREVLVSPGDRVRAGQPLVRLDGRELSANRAQAEAGLSAAEQGLQAAAAGREGAQAALALASATHKRIAELHSRNSATPHELDEAVSALRGAEARAHAAEVGIREAEAAAAGARAGVQAAGIGLSYATITSPFDGVVTEKLVEPGNMAAPGTPLVRVEDSRGFRLEVRVDEGRVAHLQPNQPVEVSLDTLAVPGEGGRTAPVRGRIAEVARALDQGSHAFLVKVELPDGLAVRSGMFGRARFAGPSRRALVVPSPAIVRRGQVTSVFVAGQDQAAHLRLVALGAESGGRVEVTAGLDEGEQVVASPPPGLVDGAPVRVKQGPAAPSTSGAGVEGRR